MKFTSLAIIRLTKSYKSLLLARRWLKVGTSRI